MLKLLRKVRRTIVESGSTRKYMIYAVGEIVLVVVGILIALQINTWNQQRINSREEKRVMRAIGEEANMFRWQIQRGFRTYNKVLASSERLVSAINSSDLKRSVDTIDYDLRSITDRWLLGMSNETNVYDAISSAGELNLISSEPLREILADLKREIMLLANYERFQAEFVDTQLFPYLNKYIDGVSISDIRQRIRKPRFEYKPFDQELDLTATAFKTSYQQIMSSKFFSNLLLQHMKNTSSLLPIYVRLKNEIVKIDAILTDYDPSLIEDK